MAKLSNIVEIILKAKDNISPELNKISGRFKEFWSSITWFVSTWAFTAWIYSAIQAASKLEETTNKFNVTFGDVLDWASISAKRLWDSFWFSNEEAMSFLANTGDLLTWMWYTQEAALKTSAQVNELAADLVSFQNVEWWIKQASDALTSWLLWEREALKSLWIVILDADIQAELLKKWLKWLSWEARLQAQAQITLELAMRQSKNAIWDYQRSIDSFANQQRELNKEVKNTVDVFWKAFLPIATEIVAKLKPIVTEIWAWITLNQWLVTNITMITWALLWLSVILWPLVFIFNTVKSAIMWVWTALKFLNVAARANPIWALITWVIALVTFREQVVWVINSLDTILEKMWFMWNVIKVVLAPLYIAFQAIKLMLTWIDFLMSKIFWTERKLELKWLNEVWVINSKLNESWAKDIYWINWKNKKAEKAETVNINLWWVTVNNEADEDRLVDKIKNSFIREKRLATMWIAM